jgi:ABC-type antimicrobial peptide transport system permease subunit
VFVVERYSQFLRKVSDFESTLALFSAVSVATGLLAGAFVANLVHDVYADRRRQYAMLSAIGFSPALGAALGLGLGLGVALLGTVTGSLVAIFFAPMRFAMPSLMADLGTITPSFDSLVAAVVCGGAIMAVAVGIVPTAWRLYRNPVAAALPEQGR